MYIIEPPEREERERETAIKLAKVKDEKRTLKAGKKKRTKKHTKNVHRAIS